MLHLISQAPADLGTLQRIGSDDAVVFLESAVLKVLSRADNEDALLKLVLRARCYALRAHLQCYGITEAELVKRIEIIDYPALVDLTVAEPLIQAWN